jgi:hypothetical protein
MFRTFILGAAMTLSATVAFAPTDASAQRYRDGYHGRHDGYRDGRRYRDHRGYRGDYRRYRGRYYRPRTRVNVYYGYPAYGYGYGYPGYYDYGYYPDYYGRGYYRSGYYPRGYYGRRYR